MTKKEIENYLKKVDALEAKLTGEDKEIYTWLIYNFDECAKLLNETEQQVKKQKEVIDKLNDLLSDEFLEVIDRDTLLDILKEVPE